MTTLQFLLTEDDLMSLPELADFLQATLGADAEDCIGMGCPGVGGSFRRWFTTLADIWEWETGPAGLVNTYFCSAVMAGRRHKEANAVRTCSIFADLDYGMVGHKKPSPFSIQAEALTHLASMPIKPSCLWDTGHGLQACWLLDAPVEFEDKERAARLNAVRGLLYNVVRSDSTSSHVNLFRIPGSINDKSIEHGCPPVQGKVIMPLDTSMRHSLDDLRAAFAPLALAWPRKSPQAWSTRLGSTSPGYTGTIDDPDELGIPDWLQGQLDDLHEGEDRSDIFFAAVRALADLDATPECMVEVLQFLPWIPERYDDRLLVEIERCLNKRKDETEDMVLDLPSPHDLVEWSLVDLGIEEDAP
jgi:hypothetical protein